MCNKNILKRTNYFKSLVDFFPRRICISFITMFALLFSLMTISIRAYALNPYADDVSGYLKYDSTLLYVSPDANISDAMQYLEVYEKISPTVLELLKQAGVRIYITPYIATDPDNATVSATYWAATYIKDHYTDHVADIPRHGWITCYTDLPDSFFAPEQLAYAIGCAIDNSMSFVTGTITETAWVISDSENWRNIYNVQNANKLKEIPQIDELSALNWPLSGASGFADAFRLYTYHSEELQKASPETYTFIVDTLKQLTQSYVQTFHATPGISKRTFLVKPKFLQEKAPKEIESVPASVASTEDNGVVVTEDGQSKQFLDLSPIGLAHLHSEDNKMYTTNPAWLYPAIVVGACIIIGILVFALGTVIAVPKQKIRCSKKIVKSFRFKLPKLTIALPKPTVEVSKVVQQAQNTDTKVKEVQDTKVQEVKNTKVQEVKKEKENKKKKNNTVDADIFAHPYVYQYNSLMSAMNKHKNISGLYRINGCGLKIQDTVFTSGDMFTDAMQQITEYIQTKTINQQRILSSVKVTMYPLERSNYNNLDQLKKAYLKQAKQ